MRHYYKQIYANKMDNLEEMEKFLEMHNNTKARTWKQPKCPSTDEWIKKMWYTYTMEYYSAIKRNKIMPFAATWMDLEIIILSQVSQTNII